jgi:hypothetical protein
MTLKSNEIKIYAPDHFKATWKKFLEICERDGQSASELVRIWVEGYVQRKDPGNPQRPLTAYAPGHEDEQARRMQEAYTRLRAHAADNGGEISFRRILRELEPHFTGRLKITTAGELEQRLLRGGVKVWR